MSSYTTVGFGNFVTKAVERQNLSRTAKAIDVAVALTENPSLNVNSALRREAAVTVVKLQKQAGVQPVVPDFIKPYVSPASLKKTETVLKETGTVQKKPFPYLPVAIIGIMALKTFVL
jgi:hypothetical protein